MYSIIDHEGENHITKVPQKLHTFKDENPYYLYVDYGYSQTYSFMRIFINNRELARTQMEYKLNLPIQINAEEMTIAADIDKKNFGKFTISMLATFKSTLSKSQRESMFDSVMEFYENQ